MGSLLCCITPLKGLLTICYCLKKKSHVICISHTLLPKNVTLITVTGFACLMCLVPPILLVNLLFSITALKKKYLIITIVLLLHEMPWYLFCSRLEGWAEGFDFFVWHGNTPFLSCYSQIIIINGLKYLTNFFFFSLKLSEFTVFQLHFFIHCLVEVYFLVIFFFYYYYFLPTVRQGELLEDIPCLI